jgi:hypothetical protein
MIPQSKIKEIEAKEYGVMTEEEALLLKYWNSYKESNMWHSMMLGITEAPDCLEKALNYARKGKESVKTALRIQGQLLMMWANNQNKVLEFKINEDKQVIRGILEDETATIHYLKSPEAKDPKNVVEFLENKKISKYMGTIRPLQTKEDLKIDTEKQLRERNLVIPAGATEEEKINISLKILDNLFWHGKIIEKDYNEMCRKLMNKKAKIA